MLTIYPSLDYVAADQARDRAIADLIDPNRWIALRPIRIIGPLAFYWTLGKKGNPNVATTWRGRDVTTPRVRWIGRAAKTLT